VFEIAIIGKKRLLKSTIKMKLQRYMKNIKRETFNYGKVSIENVVRKLLRKLKTYTRVVKCTSTDF